MNKTKHYLYKIKNKKTDRDYYGRTNGLKRRFEEHKTFLRKNEHHCYKLQDAWNEYGENAFEFIKLKEGLTLEEAIEAEQYYLDNFKDVIYNVSENAKGGGHSHYQHPNKEEILKKISISTIERAKSMTEEQRKKVFGHQGEKNPMYNKEHTKEVIERIKDKVLDYYQTHDSYRKGKNFEELFGEEKAKELRQGLSEVAKERTGEKNPFYGKVHTEETKKKVREKMKGKKPVNQKSVSIDGVVYPSATEASRQLGVVPATILHRIKSKNPKYIGYAYIEQEVVLT